MNVFEKRKKDCVPFLSSKPKPKKERKHLAVNRQQSPLRAAKVLFTTKTNGYGRMVSEKQAVEISSLKPFKNSVGRNRRRTFAKSLVSAHCSRFLVFRHLYKPGYN